MSLSMGVRETGDVKVQFNKGPSLDVLSVVRQDVVIGGRLLALANRSCTLTLLESGRTHMKTYVSGIDRVSESPIAIQPALVLLYCNWNSTEFSPVV